MVNIKELRDAIKKINIGNSFARFMPRAYYNMDDSSIIVCDLDIMEEFNSKYFDGTLTEDYINSSVETKALSEIYPNFFFIDCYITKGDLILWFLTTIEDKEIIQELKDDYFHKESLSSFKKALIKYNLFDSYVAYKDIYYEKQAINWCTENGIPYEVNTCSLD